MACFHATLSKKGADMIIILGTSEDEHSAHVARTLLQRNEDVVFFDTRLFPAKVTMKWNADEENEGYLIFDGKKYLFSDIQGVYWRNYNGILYEQMNAGDESYFLSEMVYREKKSALTSLFQSLKTNWVNSQSAFELHRKKAYLTNIVSQSGIRVPRTLITNDKNSIIEFLEKNKGDIICKPVLGGAYTKKVTADFLNEKKINALQNCPVQFQEFIDGVDIRVYAYTNSIYAFRIEADTVDFRADLAAKLIPVELPQEVIDNCYKAMELLHLKYSGIDLRLNKEGEYVFIEANPAPMFIHAERVTGAPLTDSLINMLLA